MPRDLYIYRVWGLIDGRETSARRDLGNVFLGKAGRDRAMDRLGEEGSTLEIVLPPLLYISDRLEMSGLGWS